LISKPGLYNLQRFKFYFFYHKITEEILEPIANLKDLENLEDYIEKVEFKPSKKWLLVKVENSRSDEENK
jgi:hypothetical protein